MEGFFSRNKKSKHRNIQFDSRLCDDMVNKFLDDLVSHIKQKTGLSIEHDDERLLFSEKVMDVLESSSNLDNFIYQALGTFRKNVVASFNNIDMYVKYGDCLINWYINYDDFGNGAYVIYQTHPNNSYSMDKICQFVKFRDLGEVICGANYIRTGYRKNTLSEINQVFGDSVIIKKKTLEIIVEFPDDYTESVCESDSAGSLFTEASLNDSDMFQQLNKSSSITARLVKIIKGGVTLDQSYIEEQYLQITKTKLSPISDRVIKAFDSGEIRLIYNKTTHLTTAVPFIILQMDGKMTACIFIADFCSMNKEGTMLNIEMKKLYTLMEAAFIGLKYFGNPGLFNRSSKLAKVTASIYSEMGLRILNREFALSLDKDSYDTVNYMLARFCLSKVLPLNSKEVIHAYAVSCCKAPSNLSMELASDMYEREEIKSIEGLIKAIAKNFPKMAKLTYRYYFERWISSFGMGTTLAIDSFPYLYYTIINVLLGSFLVNVTGLSEIVKNTPGISQFYAEISRVC